jgi:hypothetical protein
VGGGDDDATIGLHHLGQILNLCHARTQHE